MNSLLCAAVLLFPGSLGGAMVQEALVAIAPQVALTPLAPDYTQKDLDRMGQKAFETVKAVAPTTLEQLTFRLVERSEMRRVLAAELKPQMDCQFDNPEDAQANADAMASTMAGAVIAKFATAKREILVVRENIFDLAKLVEIEDLATVEVFSAVLCHEAAHAIDNHSHPFPAFFKKAQDTDSLQAINAIVEGHAQHVARKACALAGNLRGFEIFTASIDHLPESDNEQEAYTSRIAVSQFSFAYKDGERFIDALVKQGGPNSIRKVFQSPPTESILITEPGWYLNPKSRPKVAYDLKHALAQYESRLHKEQPDHWTMTSVELLAPQISAAFSLLPKQRYEQVVKDILECRVLIAQNAEGQGSMISSGLFALPTVPKTKHFLRLEMELIEAKPEKMKDTLTIVIHRNEEITAKESKNIEGRWIQQTITVGGVDLDNTTIVAHRGLIAAEISFLNTEMSKGEAIRVAEALLQTPKAAPKQPSKEAK